MGMSRQDFQLIADTVDDSIEDEEVKTGVCDNFAKELSQTNPRFDRQRFKDRCMGDY